MATKTIGTGARNYTTLAGWASYVNALALVAPEVADVYNDGAAIPDTANVTVGGWSGGSGTNTVTLGSASGQGFKDNVNAQTNALRWNASNGAAFTNSTGYATTGYIFSTSFTIVQNLQFKTSSALVNVCFQSSANSNTIRNNIIYAVGIRVTYQSAVVLDLASSTSTICTNNAIILNGNLGGGIKALGASTLTDNTVVCTGATTGRGFFGGYSAATVTNCVSYGFGANDYFGTVNAASDNNATDQAAFGGTNYNGGGHGIKSITSASLVSVTATTEDLRIPTGSVMKNAGKTTGPNTDIVGTSRPQGSAYDIGCWEFVTASGTILPFPWMETSGGMQDMSGGMRN